MNSPCTLRDLKQAIRVYPTYYFASTGTLYKWASMLTANGSLSVHGLTVVSI